MDPVSLVSSLVSIVLGFCLYILSIARFLLRARARNPLFLETSAIHRLPPYDTSLRHGAMLCSNCKTIPFEQLFSYSSDRRQTYLYRIGRYGVKICRGNMSNNSCLFCLFIYSCLEKLDLIDSIHHRENWILLLWILLLPGLRRRGLLPGVTILNLVTIESGLVAVYVSTLLYSAGRENSAKTLFHKAAPAQRSPYGNFGAERTDEASLNQENENFLIQKVASETPMPSVMSEPDGTNRIDFRLIRSWLETCISQHQDACGTQAWESVMQTPQNLRVIDTKNMCLVDVLGDVVFVALSYVWGGSEGSQMELNQANKQTLSIPGAFERYSQNLPLTILDSITLCNSIGQRYLWVDRLCIVQDDEREKTEQIANMDKIYGCAILTIAGADGSTANAGLAGVRANSRTAQSHFQQSHRLFIKTILPDLQLKAPLQQQSLSQQEEMQPSSFQATLPAIVPATAQPRPREAVSPSIYDSPWFHRAWTFQEWVLSKRLLVFFNNQVFWDCKCSAWCEDMLQRQCDNWGFCIDPNYPQIERLNLQPEFLQVDATAGRRDGSIEIRSNGSTHVVRCRSFKAYVWAVPKFAGRQLGYERDVLEAFKGISRIFRLCFRSSMFYGLPESLFDVALLWRPLEQLRRRRYEVKMPSWSWVGWIGKVDYETCYRLDDNYQHREVYRHESGEERLRCLIRWYRIAEGETRYTPINGEGFGIASITENDGSLPQEWTQVPARPFADFSIPRNRDLDQQCLYFWAASATFQVTPLNTGGQKPIAFEINSASGQMIGRGQFDAEYPRLSSGVEMLAISEAQFFEVFSDNQDRMQIADLGSFALYNVMLITRDLTMGVAYRVGLGRMFKKQFELNRPDIRWIALA